MARQGLVTGGLRTIIFKWGDGGIGQGGGGKGVILECLETSGTLLHIL